MLSNLHEKSMRGVGRGLLTIIAFTAILSLPFFLRPFAVNGSSMAPTLRSDDVVLVDTLSYRLVPIQRGELLVFRNPHRKTEGDRVEVDIKRVIGLPGETVHVRADKVVVDRACADASVPTTQQVPIQPEDGPCQTTYPADTLLGGGTAGGNGNEFDMHLGPQDYFVLGDNRRDSSDSRYFGTVQPENFIGRAVLRIAPLLSLKALIIN